MVTVPESAVTYSLHGNTIFVIKAGVEGQGLSQESTIVEVGEVQDGRIEIRSGLNAGVRVVTAGQNNLYRGALISVDDSIQM